MKKLNAQGFSAVEVLLLALVLAVIGFGAYSVGKNNKKAVDKSTPVAATTVKQTATTSKTPTATAKTISISEWGVKMTDSSTYTFSYTLDNSNSANGFADAKFKTDALTALGGGCETAGSAGYITRASTKITDPGYDDSSYIKIGNYYYYFVGGNGVCNGLQSGIDLQRKTYDALNADYKTLAAE